MTFTSKRGITRGIVAFGVAMGLVPAASAATLALLQDGTKIVRVDTDTKKAVGSVALAGGGALVGFDVRPADGKLYGLTPDGAIVTVDPATGAWAKVSQLSEPLPQGVGISVDFNPVADRMRVLTASGKSFRVNVTDGKATVDGALRFSETDAHAGTSPMVTAAAYSNSVAGAKETALYDVESAHALLVKQAPPNDGILATIGALGVKLKGSTAFDIWSDGKGTSVGWLLTGGRLYSVDLTTGAATMPVKVGGLKGRMLDLAILPSM